MNRSLLVITAACLVVTSARADVIGIYSDPSGMDCHLVNLVPVPDLNSMYIVHKFNAGSQASQFKINDASGLFFVSQQFPPGFLSIGLWNTDLLIAYGSCLIGDIQVATLNFFWFGGPMEDCHFFEVAAAPTSPIPGEIVVADCAVPVNYEAAGSAARAIVGPESEGCRACCVPDACRPLPTASSTWGGVKALYR